ncbi:MAG TPA: molybdopterin cofactor-binding domain-containing protein, partial [Thermomicrobiales bacterium]|nr:molybdopterin cofactor-binding domain-containing protein [Thermomicrobiales bacterium]
MPNDDAARASRERAVRIEQAASPPLAAWGAHADLTVVGRAVPRLEGREKVTGTARYSSDVRLPGQLYARVLRSRLPHARIRRIDTSRAERAPGVHAVLCKTNAPRIAWYEEGVLFETTLRMVGDEVAAVAAEREDLADDALGLIEVDYEPLPFATSIEAALRPDAPAIHDGGNIAGDPVRYEQGDPDAGLRDAAVVIDATYATHAALHNALEAHGCTAAWEGDGLTLWDSTQGVFS